jgi:GHMP kinases C terminal
LAAGAWGGKVCGAGGGGCVVFLLPADRREEVVRALAGVPGRVLDASPVTYGLAIERRDDTQGSFTFARARTRARPEEQSLDQLYLGSGSGQYAPFLLAEAIVTHANGRSGVHQETARCLMAPIRAEDGTVAWRDSRRMARESLELRATPEAHRGFTAAPTAAMIQGAIQSEESLRQFLAETEKITIYYNPAFALFSQPHESREEFLARCIEQSKRRLEEQAERLEATFRRRIDQLRERSEREQRETAENDESSGEDPQGVGFAWGQALYNITSGRPATTDTPQSMREVEYMEKIAQIQRAWDKELDQLRDDLTSRARDIEETVVSSSSVEVTKYLILWAAELPGASS